MFKPQLYSFGILLFMAFSLSGQNIFVLEKPGTIKNYKFELNDHIKLKTLSTDTTLSGRINSISDSSLIVNYSNEVRINDIATIYRKRWGFGILQKVCFFLGIPYLLISTLNGTINNDKPIIDQQTLIISGSLIAAGVVLTPLISRKHKIDNEKWRVLILDFTEEEQIND